MARKRHKPEEIAAKLGKINTDLGALKGAEATAPFKELLAQKQEAQDEYDTAMSKKVADAEDVAYNSAKRGLEQQKLIIKEKLSAHAMAEDEGIQKELAIEAQSATLAKAHQNKLIEIWGKDAAQYDAAQKKLLEIDSDCALKRLQVQLQANKTIDTNYRQTFEQVGSSVSSAIAGLIARQMTWSDAMRNILTQMLQMFVQSRVKMVTDGLAGLAQQTAGTVTSRRWRRPQ